MERGELVLVRERGYDLECSKVVGEAEWLGHPEAGI